MVIIIHIPVIEIKEEMREEFTSKVNRIDLWSDLKNRRIFMKIYRYENNSHRLFNLLVIIFTDERTNKQVIILVN